MKVFLTFSFT